MLQNWNCAKTVVIAIILYWDIIKEYLYVNTAQWDKLTSSLFIGGLQLLGPDNVAIVKIRCFSIIISAIIPFVRIFGLKAYPGLFHLYHQKDNTNLLEDFYQKLFDFSLFYCTTCIRHCKSHCESLLVLDQQEVRSFTHFYNWICIKNRRQVFIIIRILYRHNNYPIFRLSLIFLQSRNPFKDFLSSPNNVSECLPTSCIDFKKWENETFFLLSSFWTLGKKKLKHLSTHLVN